LFLASDSGTQHGLVVAVESALDNASPGFRIDLHIGDCGLDPTTRASMEEVWSRHPGIASLTFHRPRIEQFRPFMAGGLHPAALARLQMDRFIPGARRAIYLDTDVLVLGDLRQLAEVDLAGRCLAGARESCHADLASAGYDLSAIPLPTTPEAPYFNSGVMVVDLERWRECRVWETGEMLLTRYRDKFSHNDQAVLNLLFCGRVALLPDRWNRQRPICDALPILLPREGGILHFVARPKPWLFAYRPGCGAVSRWHEYLRSTRIELPPLPAPERRYRAPGALLWPAKGLDAIVRRVRSMARGSGLRGRKPILQH